MKALVTGGAGFIGSSITQELSKRGHKVTVIDDLSTGFRENLCPGSEFIKGDIQDKDLVFSLAANVDCIFHLAAMTSVEESFQNPGGCFNVNTLGFLNVLQASVKFDIKKVVFSSSSAIYNGESNFPLQESMLPLPISCYAITKLDGEHLLNTFYQEYGLKYVALRYFNVYGPRQTADSDYAAVVPIFIKKALNNEDLTIFGDGEQTRDFVFVNDVVEANIVSAEKGLGVFNVGNAESISINRLAHLIISLTHSKSRIKYEKARQGDPIYSQSDITKIKSQIEWAPNVSMEQGLRDTIEYFKNKEGLIKEGISYAN